MLLRKHCMWLALCSLTVVADTWQVLIYMDSSHQLSDMALKNLTDMIRTPLNDQVHLFVQLHAFDQVAYRYQLTHTGLVYLDEVTLKGISKQDLTTAAQWAFENNSCDHTMLIIWNHGWGILDPVWNQKTQAWELDQCKTHETHKGFLCNQTSRSYVTHQDLTEALHTIVHTTLKSTPLDILAFDTCMGAMLEIAYQVAPYANYLVSSQTCSLRDGFNYKGIIQYLNNGLSAQETASCMVNSFNSYYSTHDTSGIYTHTALDLKSIILVKNALDEVVTHLCTDQVLYTPCIEAHKKVPRFCLFPMYTDLISFITLIEQSVDIDSFTTACNKLYRTVKQCVVNRCAGQAVQEYTHGLSIYLPQDHISPMYLSTSFAQDCLWRTLLDMLNISRL